MRFVKSFLTLLAILAISLTARPKIVIGIVIDQMRFDYLYRFQPNFGPDGFNRLMNHGLNFTFAHYNYVPTHTAPGHSSIYTGSTPYFHGIIGNDWYSKELKRRIYCVDDSRFEGIGCSDKMSPLNLMSTTITDQLKLSDNGLSKVIAVSLKDRGAILPGGRLANAAYWYNDANGHFGTSSYYMKELPNWVTNFNSKNLASKYCEKEWTLSFPLQNYSICLPDENPNELDVYKEGRTSFPHSLKNIKPENRFEMIRELPFGNDLLTDFVKDLVINESLGKGEQTDFLSVSFSATDYVGHLYGPNSVEIFDLYTKLDQNIAELLHVFDHEYGAGNYLVFLTADHAGNEIPEMVNTKVKSNFNTKNCLNAVKKYAKEQFGVDGIVADYINKQFFLDDAVIEAQHLNPVEVRAKIAAFLRRTFNSILIVCTKDDFNGKIAARESNNPLLNGYNNIRSGDILIELNSTTYFESTGNKSTHNTLYSYDTHVPLIFFGWNITPGKNNESVYVTDIAPTIADLLNITEPSGCIGRPIIK
ncbi:MAG: alkaline phosphatase family protein [Ignavibacteria bacterium]|nr:alkaline phosphatase family protein [Ignavibacteria bacterium]